MLCNTMSHYPAGVDKMLFFQDNSLEKIDIINQYNRLITQGNYTEASKFINQQDGIYGYFADFFNALENRIYNLQKHLLQKPAKKQAFAYYDQIDGVPLKEGMFWI